LSNDLAVTNIQPLGACNETADITFRRPQSRGEEKVHVKPGQSRKVEAKRLCLLLPAGFYNCRQSMMPYVRGVSYVSGPAAMPRNRDGR
jgi:hypothetical protein